MDREDAPLETLGGYQDNAIRHRRMTEASPSPGQNPKVWAFGGGKGGVGKSVIAANIAVHLARQGKRCILLDADLGGANLHTLLGVSSPKVSLAHFFRREVSSLEDVQVPTPVPNLHLISGTRALLDMANPKHAQKAKILRQIRTLSADHVLLDLGAGSAFHVLDFYLAAHLPVLVVTPTPTAVENAYHFLKAAFFRRLRQAMRRVEATRIVWRILEDRLARGINSPRDLVAEVVRVHPPAGDAIAREIHSFSPRLIVNQIRQEEEMELGRQMVAVCRDFFQIDVAFVGGIRNDDRVYYAVQKKRAVLDFSPQSSFSMSIGEICRQILGAEVS